MPDQGSPLIGPSRDNNTIVISNKINYSLHINDEPGGSGKIALVEAVRRQNSKHHATREVNSSISSQSPIIYVINIILASFEHPIIINHWFNRKEYNAGAFCSRSRVHADSSTETLTMFLSQISGILRGEFLDQFGILPARWSSPRDRWSDNLMNRVQRNGRAMLIRALMFASRFFLTSYNLHHVARKQEKRPVPLVSGLAPNVCAHTATANECAFIIPP